MKKLNTPVLFVVFNRPEHTRLVFEQIKKAAPPALFIAADGPRKNKEGEEQLCAEVRSIAEKVDWECKVYKLFRTTNLGCGKAVSEAITWFFSQVEQGIILEDDCWPDSSFFYYCEKLLNAYKDNKRVLHINGFKPLVRDKIFGNKIKDSDDIFFSRFPNIWGWASWRRAWNFYSFDVNKIDIREIQNSDIYNKETKKIANRLFKVMSDEKKPIDTWDFQWFLSVWSHHGLAIIPQKSLIKNIGYGINGAHPGENLFFDSVDAKSIDISRIQTPEQVEDRIIPDFEQNILRYSLGGKPNKLHQLTHLPKYVKAKLGK